MKDPLTEELAGLGLALGRQVDPRQSPSPSLWKMPFTMLMWSLTPNMDPGGNSLPLTSVKTSHWDKKISLKPSGPLLKGMGDKSLCLQVAVSCLPRAML